MKLIQDKKVSERERRLWSMVGARLRIARKANRMSQEEIAEKLGISRQRWSMYETGKRGIRLSTLNDAIALTRVNWDFVMHGETQNVAAHLVKNIAQQHLEKIGAGG